MTNGYIIGLSIGVFVGNVGVKLLLRRPWEEALAVGVSAAMLTSTLVIILRVVLR